MTYGTTAGSLSPPPYRHAFCRATLKKHRALLDKVAEALVRDETVSGDALLDLLEAYDGALYRKLGKTRSLDEVRALA